LHGPFVAFAAKPQAKLMFANNTYLKVPLGIALTWACAFIFSYGLSHATLDRESLVYPTFQGTNLPFFITAPIAQSAFYILARKASWLLNIYIAISAICFTVFLFILTTDGGYRFTYWHQGDYEYRRNGSKQNSNDKKVSFDLQVSAADRRQKAAGSTSSIICCIRSVSMSCPAIAFEQQPRNTSRSGLWYHPVGARHLRLVVCG
jgi:hypothetical protein